MKIRIVALSVAAAAAAQIAFADTPANISVEGREQHLLQFLFSLNL